MELIEKHIDENHQTLTEVVDEFYPVQDHQNQRNEKKSEEKTKECQEESIEKINKYKYYMEKGSQQLIQENQRNAKSSIKISPPTLLPKKSQPSKILELREYL